MNSPSLHPLESSDAAEAGLVAAAQDGDIAALDALLRRHQPWIFNLALRMVWRRVVAEDATQEILVKAVTHLSQFEGRSRFSTWLYRIAVNHLLNVRKSEMEENGETFASMGRSLDACEDSDLPDESIPPVDHGLLIEEAKLGCVHAMLMCLDRRQRLVFVLGEVMGVNSEAGAAVMEISAANFRQLLARAREDLYAFMESRCGLVNTANPCRCSKKAGAFIKRGWLDPHRRQFTTERVAMVRAIAPARLDELQGLARAHADVYCSAPFVEAPDALHRLREAIAASSFNRE